MMLYSLKNNCKQFTINNEGNFDFDHENYKREEQNYHSYYFRIAAY